MSFRKTFSALFPPDPLTSAQNRTFLLVGMAALFAGYDMNIFGLATPQIMETFNIPENKVGQTVSIFRMAAILAMALCACADLVGRRRLLLITLTGQAIATFATAFTTDYTQFVTAQLITRIFGYAEEMLCFVVVAEIMSKDARGWATGSLSAMYYLGTGIASLMFAMITLLPYGWRSIYVLGAIPLLIVAYLRRNLPETERFVGQVKIRSGLSEKIVAALSLLHRLLREHPRRVTAIMIAVIGFGFAVSPAVVLVSKHLQTVLHYSPLQVTMLLVPGGLIGLVLNILAGRASDRIGRKRMVLFTTSLCAVSFLVFYNLADGWLVPASWIIAFFGFFAADAMLAGFAMEIVPTDYRATVGGLRYFLEITAGAVSLALEGVLFDVFNSHALAISVALLAIPVTLIAVIFLPEPSGKSLEELTAVS
jgi:putative MFS transporter